jgi:hypothetical protein
MVDTPAPAAAPLPMPFKPVAEQAYETGDIATARAVRNAESLIRNGVDRERVVAALTADGVDASLLDTRSPEQAEHDRIHGIENYCDPSAISLFNIPPNLVADPASFNGDVRGFLTSLALTRDAAGSVANTIVRAVQGQNAADLSASAEKNLASLKAAYGDQYEAKAKAINDMLDARASQLPNRKFVDALRPNGVIGSTLMVFGTLASRAARLSSWSSTRPAK